MIKMSYLSSRIILIYIYVHAAWSHLRTLENLGGSFLIMMFRTRRADLLPFIAAETSDITAVQANAKLWENAAVSISSFFKSCVLKKKQHIAFL